MSRACEIPLPQALLIRKYTTIVYIREEIDVKWIQARDTCPDGAVSRWTIRIHPDSRALLKIGRDF